MKFYLDDELIFELPETKQKVMHYKWFKETFKDEIKRHIQWVIMHNYEQVLKKLKEDWITRLSELKVDTIPLDDDKLAELIFSHPEYKCRSDKDQIMPDNVMDRKDLHINKTTPKE